VRNIAAARATAPSVCSVTRPAAGKSADVDAAEIRGGEIRCREHEVSICIGLAAVGAIAAVVPRTERVAHLEDERVIHSPRAGAQCRLEVDEPEPEAVAQLQA
jgi:hypothetical protein